MEILLPPKRPILLTPQAHLNYTRAFVKECIEKYPSLAVMWSGGKDSTVVLSLVREINPNIIVYFIDDHAFPETYWYIEELRKKWDLNLRVIRQYGVMISSDTWIPFNEISPQSLYKRAKIDFPNINPNLLYWTVIKTFPLREQVKVDAILTGMRWDEDLWRGYLNYEEKLVDNRAVQYGQAKTRIHPILHWTEHDIYAYIRQNRIPLNLLYKMGYRSIGDRFTTTKSTDGTERGGRAQDMQTIIYMASIGYIQSINVV